MNTQEIKKAKELYISGESLSEIGRQLNHHAMTIKKYLEKEGVHFRTRAEQNAISNAKLKKSVNEKYFDKIGVNQAWLMGFIAADGTIRKDRNTIKIGLSSVDKEILEKIKEEVQIERPILDYLTNNGFAVSQLEWTSKNHKDFLAKYGIVNNKTYLPLHLPKDFNEEQKLAFILGYFDGDGSISRQDEYLRFRICSHRDEILQDIAKFFISKYNNLEFSVSKDKRNLWELSISTKYAKQIFLDMYNLNSLRLNRKFQKFLEYINHETTTSQPKG